MYIYIYIYIIIYFFQWYQADCIYPLSKKNSYIYQELFVFALLW